MARPIKAAQIEKEPIGYQSVTVRLSHATIEALNKFKKGSRADFIRKAIEEKLLLKKEGT
jgi:hypothetical protein